MFMILFLIQYYTLTEYEIAKLTSLAPSHSPRHIFSGILLGTLLKNEVLNITSE